MIRGISLLEQPTYTRKGPEVVRRALAICAAHQNMDVTNPESEVFLASLDAAGDRNSVKVIEDLRKGVSPADDKMWRFSAAHKLFADREV